VPQKAKAGLRSGGPRGALARPQVVGNGLEQFPPFGCESGASGLAGSILPDTPEFGAEILRAVSIQQVQDAAGGLGRTPAAWEGSHVCASMISSSAAAAV